MTKVDKQFTRLCQLVVLGVVLTFIGGASGTALQDTTGVGGSLVQTACALTAFAGVLIFLLSLGWVLVKIIRG